MSRTTPQYRERLARGQVTSNAGKQICANSLLHVSGKVGERKPRKVTNWIGTFLLTILLVAEDSEILTRGSGLSALEAPGALVPHSRVPPDHFTSLQLNSINSNGIV